MRISKYILVMWLAAGAWALTPPPKQQAAPQAAAKPSGARAVSPSLHVVALTKSEVAGVGAASRNTSGPLAPSGKPGRSERAVRRISVSRTAVSHRRARKGERDPFVSPIVERTRMGAQCSGSGRQCLSVGEISLHGVVRGSPGGNVAVVMDGIRTYFLRENDPLADGSVERITGDAITLRQRSSDVLGRTVVHEVTKKLGAPAV